jgi:hypothetical protein
VGDGAGLAGSSAGGESSGAAETSGIGNGGDVYRGSSDGSGMSVGTSVGRGVGVGVGGGVGSGVMRGSGNAGSVATLITWCRFHSGVVRSSSADALGEGTGVAEISEGRLAI